LTGIPSQEKFNTLLPPPSVIAWAGLRAENRMIGDLTITVFNDGDPTINVAPKSFKEIADIIEKSL